MDFDEAAQALETDGQQYQLMEIINALRRQVDAWRAIPDPARWRVTPETARLLQHWRSHRFGDIRPFFCQVEAAETAIWLTEVAPALGNEGRRFLDHLAAANEQANPGLDTPGAEARDRCRQDHRHGHAHRVADRQRGAPSRQPEVHARIPGGHPGSHHPRPPAGAPAERPGQLLPKPRAGAGRPARRPGPRQDRHHQLPRLHAARDPRHLEGGTRPPPGPGSGDRDPRDRGPDAPAGDAGPHGHEEHPRAQRRGPPLLPREAVRGGRGRPAEGRRPHRGCRRTRKPHECGSRAWRRCAASSVSGA